MTSLRLFSLYQGIPSCSVLRSPLPHWVAEIPYPYNLWIHSTSIFLSWIPAFSLLPRVNVTGRCFYDHFKLVHSCMTFRVHVYVRCV